MRLILMKVSTLLIAIVVIGATILLPTSGMAQGRGRGHGRGLSMKSGKFINGHDARDGRFDGRGPAPSILSLRNRHRRHGRHKVWMKRR